jgi:hypothetical protein
MFKGSKEFNKEKGTSIWSVLQDVGASINATVSNSIINIQKLRLGWIVPITTNLSQKSTLRYLSSLTHT